MKDTQKRKTKTQMKQWIENIFPFRNKTFLGQLLVCTGKSAAADLLVQKYIEKRPQIDMKRNAAFTCFGVVYTGWAQWHLYLTLFKKILPKLQTLSNLPWRQKLRNRQFYKALFIQISIDNLLYTPLLYYPSFYGFLEIFQHGPRDFSWQRVSNTYQTNFLEDNITMMACWIPADIFLYGLVPLSMRLYVNHAISFIWTCGLSYLRG